MNKKSEKYNSTGNGTSVLSKETKKQKNDSDNFKKIIKKMRRGDIL